jgi:phenylacetate-CoA ligase
MFIFRGVNIYPAEIDSILSEVEGINSEYQIILERKEDGKDYMTVRVEREFNADNSLDRKIKKIIGNEIKKRIMVTSYVEIVDYKSLPRSERKTKRVFDNRFN